MKYVIETIVQASHDNGACYVAKYAEVVFERGKNINVEGPQVLQEMMKTMNPHQKFPRSRTGRWDQEKGNL